MKIALVLRAGWCALVLGGLVACTSSATGDGTDTSSGASSKKIGSTGGSVSAPDGTLISIPEGALPTDTTITITIDENVEAPGDTELVGTAYVFGPEGTQFSKPITISLPFDPTKVPAGRQASEILVFTAPAGSTDYTSLGGKVQDATHVSATTTHFSVFVPVIPSALPTDAGGDADASDATDATDASDAKDATDATDATDAGLDG
jgi:hypothetical protein